MALRKIYTYPDPVLKQVCTPVVVFDDELKALVRDMAETMYAAPGVGLAAPQVGVAKRIFVMDAREGKQKDQSTLRVFINPEIVKKSGEIIWEEGCLSLPEIHEEMKRADKVLVRAVNENGEPFEIEVEGFPAVVVQHEYDHLDGILMFDRMSSLKRRFAIKRYNREKAKAAEK